MRAHAAPNGVREDALQAGVQSRVGIYGAQARTGSSVEFRALETQCWEISELRTPEMEFGVLRTPRKG
eukprot:6220795-Alexandrium_andersonii.AAC.1